MGRKPIKTRLQILNSPYLYKTEILRLLDQGDEEADTTFRFAQEYDIQMAGGYDRLVSKTKVTIEAVLHVTGKTEEMLEKQVKNAELS